ncbi:MAG: DEAD/DEAH box helicase [Kineosporiaceae bacterium]
MYPSLVAEDLRATLSEFLGATFALSDDDVRAELRRFLEHPTAGIFRGPFVRVRLPFRAADPAWRDHLEWAPTGFVPHRHQARAFARLDSRAGRPRPTLVTTGTGSGKTESFLLPVLDHARRHRAAGRRGLTAVLLYPMNALANDQARRLARLIHDEPALRGITAGLYTGDDGGSPTMTEDALIGDRHALRADPPDILLTNYKMLDYLLLRSDDNPLWAGAADSLQYVVLDEFHTYDGAQGTDVAMLMRRLGARVGLADGERPLGRATPVATSATLGGDDALDRVLTFACQVFGEQFDADAVIGEDRLDATEWAATASLGTALEEHRPTVPAFDAAYAALHRLGTYPRHETLVDLAAALFLGNITSVLDTDPPPRPDPITLGVLLARHPLTARLTEQAQPRPLDDVLAIALPQWNLADPQVRRTARAVVSGYLALVSAARTPEGTPFLQVEVQQWIREVRRLLRRVSAAPAMRWDSDHPVDGPLVDLPAVYCRHCGRSGWAATRPPAGTVLDVTPARIWRDAVVDPGRQVTLIHAPGEASAPIESEQDDPTREDRAKSRTAPAADGPLVLWLSPSRREVVADPTGDDDAVPVLPPPSRDDARNQTCPACGLTDGIRFMGSRVATLVSVVLGHLFGSADLPDEHKKTLVFTDSVQDAAHRAAFVEDRSYALNQRATLAAAIDAGVSLDGVAPRQLDSADRRPLADRYALLPPDLHEHDGFRPFWHRRDPGPDVRALVRQRLSFGAVTEFGLNSRTGRSLELTGTIAAIVTLGQRRALMRDLRRAVDALPRRQEALGDSAPAAGAADGSDGPWWTWLWGVLERMRTSGAIEHRWFDRYLDEDGNRWSIWGGRPREDGMPAFPRGRPAPSYPVTAAPAARPEAFSLITSPRGWYAQWTQRCLHVPALDAPDLLRCLFDVLTQRSVLRKVVTSSGSTAWVIPPAGIELAPVKDEALKGGTAMLRCSVCSDRRPGIGDIHEALKDGPCLRDRCPGRYGQEKVDPDYYRRLYREGSVRRIVAREHTGLLDGDVRAQIEASFKDPRTPDAPNVLACTPTLELGIDIGDLSVVTLTSLPRSAAAYLQRVGRAGRRSGQALVIAVLPGRPLELRRLADPLSLVAGHVVPPACHLDAAEILHRQYLAYLIDCAAARGESPPTTMRELMRAGTGAGSWLAGLLDDVRLNGAQRLDSFLALFGTSLGDAARAQLKAWATPSNAAPSGLERVVVDAAARWRAEREERIRRGRALAEELTRLDALGDHVDDDTKRDRRQVRGELNRARATVRDRDHQYWISGLEALGVLPNYALLDDRTTLDVALWWRDEDTGRAETTESQYARGSRVALTELAPGAVFYVRGSALHIDAVTLSGHGGDARSGIQRRRLCPTCSWSGPDRGPEACPRCGDARAADTGQVLDAVLFRGASAYESRDTARAGDRSDDRERIRFLVAAGIVPVPDSVAAAWRLREFPFGIEFSREADITWYNIGPEHAGGRSRTVFGVDVAAPLFLTCRHCGVVPAAQRTLGGGRRTTTDARHRGWCSQRHTPDPDGWVDVALMHQLRTQTVRMLVPPVVMRDAVLLESFRAALLRGLRDALGGDPDHLDILIGVAGRAGNPQPVMVLHDLVPGGTGYLGELSDPMRLQHLLKVTLQVLEECPCAQEGLAACHRCLLGFVPPHLADVVRRDRAADLLREILGHWDVEDLATLDELEVGAHESPLEIRFRQALQAWLRTRNAAVAVTAQAGGDAWTFRLGDPSTGQDLRWTLAPQVDLGGVRPDFTLTAPETPLRVAVFTDGAAYHAHPAHNRLADDARKRALLRDRGWLVWSLTHEDVDTFLAGQESWEVTATPHTVKVGPLPAVTQAQASAYLHLVERLTAHAQPGGVPAPALTGDPLTVLVRLLQRPDITAWNVPARAYGLAIVDRMGWETTVAPSRVADIAADLARFDVGEQAPSPGTGEPLLGEGARKAARRRSPAGVGLVLMPRAGTIAGADVVVALDDRDDVVGSPTQLRAWREWLALGNLLQLGVTDVASLEWVTVTSVDDDVFAPTASAEPAEDTALEAWLTTFLAQVDPGARPLLRRLTRAAVDGADVGYETDEGVPVEVAWPRLKVALLLEPDDDVQAWAEANGWATALATDAAAEELLATHHLVTEVAAG